MMWYLFTPTCQADDRSAGILIPIWSTKSGESRYNITAVCIFSLSFAIYSQSSAESIRRSSSRSHWIAAPATKIEPSVAYVTFPSRPQAIVVTSPLSEKDRLLSGVHQKETAGSVSILRISRFKAGLPEKCRLLISGSTGNRDRSAEDGRICLSVNAAGRLWYRKHTAWDLKFFENLVIPV